MAMAMVRKLVRPAHALREGRVLGELQLRFRGNAGGEAGGEEARRNGHDPHADGAEIPGHGEGHASDARLAAV
jgi:hypothetical protein